MKKWLIISTLLLTPTLIFAQLQGPEQAPAVAPTLFNTGNALFNYIQKVLNWVFAAIILVAVVYMLIIAFQYVTSGGKKDTVGQLGNAMMWIFAGIAIAVLAKGLVFAICNLLAPGSCTFWQ